MGAPAKPIDVPASCCNPCCPDSDYTGKILTLTSTYISTSPAMKEVYEFRGVYSGGGVFTGKTHYRAWSMAAGYQLSCYNITGLTLIDDQCYNDTVEYRCNSVVDPAGFYFVGAAGSAASVYNNIYLPTTQPNCGRDPLCTVPPLSGFGVGKLVATACQYTYGCLGGTYQNDFCVERWSGSAPSTCIAPLGNSFEWQLATTTISIASGIYSPIC